MTPRVIASGRSCLECRRRKIRCDRSLPCEYCARVRIHCTYPAPKSQDRDAIPTDVGALPSHVERLGADLRFLKEDMANVRRRLSAIEDDLSGSSQAPFWSFASDSSQAQGPTHPPPSTLCSIWQRYLKAIDPVLKIFHVPTVQSHVLSLLSGRQMLDMPTSCLIFAVYYATVATMPATECQSELGEKKSLLLGRYRLGVERCFIQADFPKSTDITVLQAFLLYLIGGKEDPHGPDVYMLLGVAIRMATKMGIHVDGAATGFSPFEVEMRRRIWWHIYALDVLTAEDQGLEPTIMESTFTTQLPSNISDAELDLNMSELPPPRNGRTEMLFSLVRFEVIRFARTVQFSDQFCQTNSYSTLDVVQKCEEIDKFKTQIEERYLSYCDRQVSLDRFTVTIHRLLLEKLKLKISKPEMKKMLPVLHRGGYHDICINILCQSTMLRQSKGATRWLWLFSAPVEWDALAYLILGLCLEPTEDAMGTAWKTASEAYHTLKDNDDFRCDPRGHHIEQLWVQVLAVRERANPSFTVAQPAQPGCSNIPEQPVFNAAGVTNSRLPAIVDAVPDHLVYCMSGSRCGTERSHPVPVAPESVLDHTTRGPSNLARAGNSTMSEPPSPINVPSDSCDLPGAGTSCEWSAAVMQQYWRITEPGQEHSQ